MLVQCQGILLFIVLKVNFGRLLGFLGPEERDRAPDLNMREQTLADLNYQFAFHEIRNVAVLIYAA